MTSSNIKKRYGIKSIELCNCYIVVAYILNYYLKQLLLHSTKMTQLQHNKRGGY